MTEAALAQFRNRQLSVEATGQATTVPDDSIARLMYYLKCISCLLDDCVPANLTNYSQYSRLDSTEKLLVIRLALELTPDKVPVFIPVSQLPDGSGNEFLTFSSLDETVTALGIQHNGAAMMALRRQVGNRQRLVQVMAYTPSWIQNNYLNPLMNIRRDIVLSQLLRQLEAAQRPKKPCTIL